MDTFKPTVYLDRAGLTQIRPLVEVPEKTLTSLSRREEWPIMENPCPMNDQTWRKEMGELVEYLSTRYPDFRQSFRTALLNSPFWNQK